MSTRKFPSQFTQKVTPVSADKLMIADSADSNIIKYITFADVQWPQWVGITWRWAYNGATAYSVNDAVSYTDWLSYICILASTGNVPTNATYWGAMVSYIDASTSVKWVAEEATLAEQGTQTATGATWARLFINPVNTAKTSSWAGDENKIPLLNSSWQLAEWFINTAAIVGNDNGIYLAWENITAWQPVYLNTSDYKLYKADATTDTKCLIYWFAYETKTTGNAIKVTLPWSINTSVSGLTQGSEYYLTNTAGTISTTPWTTVTAVWYALTTTKLYVYPVVSSGVYNTKPTSKTSSNVRLSADTARSTTTLTPWTLVKSIRAPFSWIVNVYQEIKNTWWFTVTSVIYRSGISLWSSWTNSTVNTTYTAFNNDIYVNEWDLVELYYYTNNASGTASVQNFRLRYDVVVWPVGKVVTD